jgi:hypothetical protein
VFPGFFFYFNCSERTCKQEVSLDRKNEGDKILTASLPAGKKEIPMQKKVRWITETAVMLALLICLQYAGSLIPHQMTKQLITGTFVNCVLAVATLYAGWGSGIAIALVSPVCACLLGIAPNFITVLPIMAGNVCYVVLLRLIAGKTGRPFWKQPVALAAAATVKFGVLYVLVVKIICGVMAASLLAAGTLKEPMLKALPATFSWPQLVTALIGGGIALLIAPVIRKALKR